MLCGGGSGRVKRGDSGATIPEARVVETVDSNGALLTMSHKLQEEDVRKQRLSDSIAFVRERLDNLTSSLRTETHVTTELRQAFFKRENRMFQIGVALGCVFPAILAILAAGTDLSLKPLLVGSCVAFWSLLVGWRSIMGRRNQYSMEALNALNHVATRISELQNGLERCERIVNLQLESDTEWQEREAEDRKRWEEERDLFEKQQIERLSAQLNASHLSKPVHLEVRKGPPHTSSGTLRPKASASDPRNTFRKDASMKKGKSFRQMFAGSFRALSKEDPDVLELPGLDPTLSEPPFPETANKTWVEYVDSCLPLERRPSMTEPERAFSKQLRERSKGKWDELPLDLKLMALRAWETRKDRLEFTLEQIDYVVNWRQQCKADGMLASASDPLEERFFGAWRTRFGGEDIYGHPIVYDRVEDFDLDHLYTLSDEQVLTCHTKQMEVLRRRKLDISKNRKQRVCKHVYILDLKGLSLNKHFTVRMKNLLTSIFKVEGTAYPDSLWSLWLVNTPMVFKFIWSALSPGIDPASKAKIRMRGGSSDYIPEMIKCGIPKSAIPTELDGTSTSTMYWNALKSMIENDKPAVERIQVEMNASY